LIVKRDGRLLLQPAAVRDWPDFKTRCNGAPFSENLRGDWYGILSAEAKGDLAKARRLADGWVAAQKRHFDWLLRAKINMAWNRTNINPGDAREKTTIARAALREVHEYGWKRGILAMDADTTSIGRFPQDQNNADFNRCVLSRSHGKYFCWSRLDYHRRRAERAAGWLADCGYRGYYLHATDSGGWVNPALWEDRCEECRKMYGDDHAKADATVFGIYYGAIKQRIPEARIVAVVYPYTGRYLDPDYVYRDAAATMGQGDAARHLAEQTAEKLTSFLERLDSLLPPDVAICIRESERGYLDLARRAWGRRPFYLYYEYAFWKGWRPYFLTTPLMTQSLYYSEYDDILFGNVSGSGWREVSQLLGVECAWHVNRPGATDFDSAAWHDWGTEGEVPDQRRAFAQRACRFWFGEEAAALIAPAFAENISHHYICFPEDVLDRVKLTDPVRTMQKQAQATDRAASSFDKLWDLQQRSSIMPADHHAYFLNLYQMTHAARILAGHRTAIMAARQAIRHRDRQEVQRQLATARTLLDKAAPAWSAVNQRIPRNERLASPTRKTSTAGLLSTLDPAELRQEVDDLAERCDELIAVHTIPGWFKRDCRKRKLLAVRTTQPMTVDGRLDEAVWTKAPRIEHFMDRRTLRLESLETVGRLAYDDDTLYVAMECFDPKPAEIATAMPAHFSSLEPAKLNIEEGTIEFWIRPSWDVEPRSTGPRGSLEHTLLNIGPVRPDHLYLSNHSSLTISQVASGNLSAILSNRSYEARTVSASIRDWQAGQWHHIALQWKLDDGGRTAMALYVDGRLASDRCLGNTKHPNDRPLKMKPLPFPVQVGSMNTGYRPADAWIDELRISSVRRYDKSFVPEKRFDADNRTLALFHFDGDLDAETPAGSQFVPGPVQ